MGARRPLLLSVLIALVAALGMLLGPLAANAGASPLAVRPHQTSASPGAYTALANPSRICDTRAAGAGGSVANQCTGKTLSAGGTLDVPLTGVPLGATAVEVNVTVTNTAGTGFLNVYPTGSPSTTSVLDFTKGQTVANLVTVGIGTNNSITLADGPATGTGGATDAVVDLLGYYMPQTVTSSAGTYTALSPARIADTRCGASPAPSFCASESLPAANATLTTLGPAGTINVQATGVGNVPASGVSQVLVNLTIVKPTAGTFLSAYATGQAAPTAGAEFSNLNANPGEIIAGKAIVDVNSAGQFTVFNHAGNADVVVDVEGYFSSSSGAAGAYFTPVPTPVRVIGSLASGTTVAAGSSTSATISGANGVPSDATAAALDVIDIAPKLGNFLTVYPTSATPPVASDVNWIPANTYNVVPNAAFGTLSSTGSVSVLNGPADTNNNAGPTAVDADLFGYFSPLVVAPTGLDITVPSTTATTFDVTPGSVTPVPVNAAVTYDGAPVNDDNVLFTESGSAPGVCGTLNGSTSATANTGTTSGGVATVSYIPTTTAGNCTITALDSIHAQTGTGAFVQTTAPNTVTVTPTNPTLPASTSNTVTLSATVTPTTDNDAVTFTSAGTPSAACGTLGAPSGTTGSTGLTPVTSVYTASTTPGFCTVTATEAATGGTGTTVIDQTSSPALAAATVTLTAPPSTTAITGASQTEGTSATYQAAVANLGGALANDPVSVTTNAATACGTVSPATTTTNSSGDATFSYTAGSSNATTCVITVKEADTGAAQTLTVAQTAAPVTVTITPNPGSVTVGGSTTVDVAVSNITSAANGDTVTWSAAPATSGGGAATCGAFSSVTTLAVASGATTGTGSATYNATGSIGFCTLTASITAPPGSGTSTMDQSA
ncbi:MAG: beta strand repeat-containing protein [Acidimicrobiales bacterium]